MKCPKCDIDLVPGVALTDGKRYCFSSEPSDGTLIKIMKCSKCGHSETNKGQ